MYDRNFKYRNSYKWLFANPEFSIFLRSTRPYLSKIEQFSNKSREISTHNTRQYQIEIINKSKKVSYNRSKMIKQIKLYQAKSIN